jgi:hypothetical protein
VYLFDLKAAQNPRIPSTYGSGMLTGYRDNLFIMMLWEQTPGLNDPQAALITIQGDDQIRGLMKTERMGEQMVTFVELQTTQTNSLPFGMVAAWQCADRRFGWKIYTAQEGIAQTYLEESLARMRCGANE